MAPQDIAADRSFGPQYGEKFDFTLHFQELIFTFIPAIIAIASSPFCAWAVARHSQRILVSLHFWCKAALCLGIVGLDAAILGAWVHSPEHSTDTSVAAAALSFVASLSIATIVAYTHLRSLQSSALASMYLSTTLLFDIMRARSYYARDGMELLAILSVSSAAIKLSLVVAEEVSKRSMVSDKDLRASVGPEALSGFWNRSLFIWLNPILFTGYRKVISYEDLPALGPEFASEKIYQEFSAIWNKTTQSKYCLIKACFRVYYVSFFVVFIPEFCNSAFKLLQPLFLRRAIQIVGEDHTSQDVKDGIIGAAVIIFFGVAVANATAMHLQYRLTTKLRGAIIMALFKKSLTLTFANAKESAAVSLMSTDIDGIVEGIPEIHKIFSGFIEACIGVYILTTFVSAGAAIAVGTIVFSAVVSVLFGRIIVRARTQWNEQIQLRVAKTSTALAQLKNIKMMGLAPALSKSIQNLRIEELAKFRHYRYIAMYFTMSIVFMDIMAPVFVIAGAFFSSIWNRHLSAGDTFGTLLVLALITYPLMDVMHGYSTVASTVACFHRIQAYLVAPDTVDSRTILPSCQASGPESCEKGNVPSPGSGGSDSEHTQDNIIEFSNASISATAGATSLLKKLFLSFKRATFSIIIGPTGTGKTTFLRSVLGEAAISAEAEASVRVIDESIAYCGQTPWIRNESIRSNILSGLPYERVWYEFVVHACLLTADLQQLPRGDLTRAGNNGCKLSGGQRQRIAVARAFYSRARIVVIDDVLGSLDKATAEALFARVFGADGLVQRSQSTVLLATHAIEYVNGADQVIMIDADGSVTSQHHLDSSNLAQSFLDGLKRENNEAEKDEPSTKHTALDSDDSEEAKPPRQSGDMSLYAYYFSSVPKRLMALWVVTLFLTTLSELAGEIYLRGWIEVAPDNSKYFIGYALLGASASFIAASQGLIYYMTIIPAAVQTLHKILLDTVVGATHQFFASNDQASILNRFSQDMALLTLELPVTFFRTFYLFSFMVLKGIIIAVGMKYTAPIIVASFIFFYFLGMYYLRTSRQIRFLDLEARAPLFAEFTETASGLEHIRAFGWQAQVMSRGSKALDHSQKPFYCMFAIQRWLLLSLDLLTLVLSLSVVTIALYTKGQVSQPSFGLSLFMAIQINTILTGLLRQFAALETALGAVSRLRTFAETTPMERTPDDAVAIPKEWPSQGGVIFQNVTARYDTSEDSKPALDDVSVKILPGETVAIVGRTGSGKSSMILTLLNFLEHTGTITVDGIDVSKVPHAELRSRITTVSQEPVVLQGTVRDNLLPYDGQQSGEISDDAIMDVLRQVCLFDHIMAKGGLDVTYADVGFSHGQEQLLSIARAILHSKHTATKLVLMDEPTSNVDAETDAVIQRLIGNSFGNSTVLIVSHRAGGIRDVNVTLQVSDAHLVGVERRDATPSPI